jgi:hypothetical protein
MNFRRLMSDMARLLPSRSAQRRSAYHTLNLPERGTGRYRPKQRVLRHPRVANMQRGCPRRQSSSLGPASPQSDAPACSEGRSSRRVTENNGRQPAVPVLPGAWRALNHQPRPRSRGSPQAGSAVHEKNPRHASRLLLQAMAARSAAARRDAQRPGPNRGTTPTRRAGPRANPFLSARPQPLTRSRTRSVFQLWITDD